MGPRAFDAIMWRDRRTGGGRWVHARVHLGHVEGGSLNPVFVEVERPWMVQVAGVVVESLERPLWIGAFASLILTESDTAALALLDVDLTCGRP